ncbi:CAAX prenyl protease-related protein [Massilia sp. R2A-15]|uniref:CAAX prenyl protease-related protein n=1 Tax=Massilia sp. R2A-15 TaxID=3064278 RepID=UPI0027344A24|nr:CAAX prenyl protease-related protein [Massilia sp. R2A-15]WLI90237.1 CAAX prenyl protease-related protein [Massilia sp. R2A-15]
MRVLPFAVYLAFIALTELLARLGWTAAELRWLYAVKAATVALALAVFWRHYTELHIFRLRPPRLLFALAVGVVVLVLWIGLGADWMTIGTSAGFDPTTNGRIDWALVVVRIAGAALVVPVMEELFWRSFLLRWLDNPDFDTVAPAQVTIRSVLISSVLFGFEHNLWLAGIVAGLAYSALYMRHRTIWSPILAHAVTNGLLGAWVVHTGSWSYW